jgi:hypothetical protein
MKMEVPILRIEIEGMKRQINAALMGNSEELNKMIAKAIDKSFSVEAIQYKIDMQVAKALDNAIDNLSNCYPVRQIIEDIVVKSLTKKRDEIERNKND